MSLHPLAAKMAHGVGSRLWFKDWIQSDTFDAVLRERDSQDEKWGEQNHPDGTSTARGLYANGAKMRNEIAVMEDTLTWRGILDEEVQEAFAETDPERLREELIQVAAVAIAWLEALERRTV